MINIKSLGINQLGLLMLMVKQNLVIRECEDVSDGFLNRSLEDEDGANSYQHISTQQMRSLVARDIFSVTRIQKTIDITIYTFRIKPAFITAMCWQHLSKIENTHKGHLTKTDN